MAYTGYVFTDINEYLKKERINHCQINEIISILEDKNHWGENDIAYNNFMEGIKTEKTVYNAVSNTLKNDPPIISIDAAGKCLNILTKGLPCPPPHSGGYKKQHRKSIHKKSTRNNKRKSRKTKRRKTMKT